MVYLKTDLGTRSEELWSETRKEEKRVINEIACSEQVRGSISMES